MGRIHTAVVPARPTDVGPNGRFLSSTGSIDDSKRRVFTTDLVGKGQLDSRGCLFEAIGPAVVFSSDRDQLPDAVFGRGLDFQVLEFYRTDVGDDAVSGSGRDVGG
jgi:hypothetical protein